MRAYSKFCSLIIARFLLATIVLLLLMTGCGVYHSSETKDKKFQTLQHGMAPQVPGQYDGKTAVYRLTIADRAAERVVMLDEVDQAFVVLYDGNAYAAVQLKRPRVPIPREIQEKISQQVMAEAPVEQVYITPNLKFVDLIYAYINDANLGRSDEDMEHNLEMLLRDSFQAQFEDK